MEAVAKRFHTQYSKLIIESSSIQDDALLQERLKKGAEYFAQETTYIGPLLLKTKPPTENKQAREQLLNLKQVMRDTFLLKRKLLLYVAENGFRLQEYLKKKVQLTLDQSI